MKVLQLIPALVSGGAEQAVLAVNAALVQAGHAGYAASSGGPMVSAVEAADGTHYTLPMTAKNPARMLANAFRLRDIILAQNIDIIHARSRAPAWSGLWAARMTGRHFITTFHAAYGFDNPVKKFYNGVMARGETVIAISDFIAAHIGEHYHVPPSRIAVIRRGVDLTRFHPDKVAPERIRALQTAWGVPAGRKVAILPARLSRIKGHLVLIEALWLLPGDVRPFTVMIGADQAHDAYGRELRAAIRAAGLEGQIVLAGHCQDMPAAYAAAQMVIAPSLKPEGFGRVPVEAQAMGIPVIASDLGGFRETIIPGVTGWLFAPGDAQTLANAIAAAMQLTPESCRTLALQAINHARTHFDAAIMTQKTLEVYQKVLEC
mgnify:CR=1 FL=1